MKNFSNIITLSKNFRGVYELDTSKGCYSGMINNKKGCYNECYAFRSSKKWGFDFSKTILRNFIDEKHILETVNKINKIDMPFIRIGVTGDPSENWEHTLKICEKISKYINKKIVIITKHWKILTMKQLIRIKKLGLCINTSISALDNKCQIVNRLKQYNRLKKYCKSVLRIVSCKFNNRSKTGRKLNNIQKILLKNKNIIETIFRVHRKNKYVEKNIIKIEKSKFLGKLCYISKNKKDIYFGKCKYCIEKCGVDQKFLNNSSTTKFQDTLF